MLFPRRSNGVRVPSVAFRKIVTRRITSSSPFSTFFGNKDGCIRMGGGVIAPGLAVGIGTLPSNGPTGFSKKMKRFAVDSSVDAGRLGAGSTMAVGLIVSNANGLGLIGAPRMTFPGSFRMCSPGVSGGFALAHRNLSNGGIVRCLTVPERTNGFAVPPIRFSCFSLGDGDCGAVGARTCGLGIRGNTKGTSRIVTSFAGGRSLGMLKRSVHCVGVKRADLAHGKSFFFNSAACCL